MPLIRGAPSPRAQPAAPSQRAGRRTALAPSSDLAHSGSGARAHRTTAGAAVLPGIPNCIVPAQSLSENSPAGSRTGFQMSDRGLPASVTEETDAGWKPARRPGGCLSHFPDRQQAWFPRGRGYGLAEPMAVESKPLFHPEIIRRSVRAFPLPELPSAAVSRLGYWAELIAPGRADTFKETALLPEFLTDILARRLGWRSSNGDSYSSSVSVAPFHD